VRLEFGAVVRTVDYTARRLGSKTPDGKIIVCEKCGRRGASRLIDHGRTRMVTHEQELRGAPFPHWHLEGDMFCMWVVKLAPAAPAPLSAVPPAEDTPERQNAPERAETSKR
jgi:hypothetical protein